MDTHTPILEAQLPQVSNFEKTSKKLTEFYGSRLVVDKSVLSFGKKGLRESVQDTAQIGGICKSDLRNLLKYCADNYGYTALIDIVRFFIIDYL